ncbi:hypothetical protein H1C71_030331 [Ictidomys tridecemlineatus]|nr:hypothetical protein H1C71_030331 [Ictidomys tridecemlineatus]
MPLLGLAGVGNKNIGGKKEAWGYSCPQCDCQRLGNSPQQMNHKLLPQSGWAQITSDSSRNKLYFRTLGNTTHVALPGTHHTPTRTPSTRTSPTNRAPQESPRELQSSRCPQADSRGLYTIEYTAYFNPASS